MPLKKEVDFKPASSRLSIFCQVPKSINEMMELLGWSDRTKFRKRFVYPLIKQGVLEMTIRLSQVSSKQNGMIKVSKTSFFIKTKNQHIETIKSFTFDELSQLF